MADIGGLSQVFKINVTPSIFGVECTNFTGFRASTQSFVSAAFRSSRWTTRHRTLSWYGYMRALFTIPSFGYKFKLATFKFQILVSQTTKRPWKSRFLCRLAPDWPRERWHETKCKKSLFLSWTVTVGWTLNICWKKKLIQPLYTNSSWQLFKSPDPNRNTSEEIVTSCTTLAESRRGAVTSACKFTNLRK